MTTRWKRITAKRYDEMLNILPPLDWYGGRFLVPEPITHNDDGQPVFAAFVQIGDEHFECCRPLTRRELRAIPSTKILENVDAS